MLNFIAEFPILSLFILGWILSVIGGYFYDKPKYWRYWKITTPITYLGLLLIIVSGLLKI